MKSLLTIILIFTLNLTKSDAKQYNISSTAELESLPNLLAGDEVILSAGTYSGVETTLNFTGTASEPVRFYANPAGSAVFTGETRIILNGEFGIVAGLNFNGNGGPAAQEGVIKFETNSRNLMLHNCQFKDFDTREVSDANWVFVAGFNHVITHCSFEGKTSKNATVFIKPDERNEAGPTVTRNHKIRYCYFGPRTEIGSNGYEAIRISDSSRQHFETRCDISYNYFYRAISSDGASEMEVISNKSRGNLYRGNILEECDGQITIRHGRDCIVEENYIIGTGGSRESGVRIVGSGHVVRNNYIENVNGDGLRSALCIMDGQYELTDNSYEGVENSLIEGNVIVNCKASINFGENKGLNDPPRNTSFLNNTIYNNQNQELFEIESNAHFSRVSGNEVYTSASSLGSDLNPLNGGYIINATLDRKLPFDTLLEKNSTGHDFSKIFINNPVIGSPEVPLPLQVERHTGYATLSFNADQNIYMNIYVSSDLEEWKLYGTPEKASTTGTQNLIIQDSRLPENLLKNITKKLFYQVILDDEPHHEVAHPTGEPATYTERDGQVIMEAENFTLNSLNSDEELWQTQSNSERTYIVAGDGSSATWSNGAIVSYSVNFTTTGTYYIHPLFNATNGSSDSFWFGLAGTQIGQVNTGISIDWAWDNNEGEQIHILTPGIYQIEVRRREAGLKLDRIILTTDANANFSGNGPNESARSN